MNQQQLTEWAAGFFDGEGTIGASVGRAPRYNVDHIIQARGNIQCSYMGGFFDAEGYVGFYVGEKSNARLGHRADPLAKVHHLKNDPLVRHLGEFADAIGIEPNVTHKPAVEDDYKAQFRWTIADRAGLRRFLRAIRPHSIVKRPEIDIMLEEILPRLEDGYHSDRRGFLELVAWKDVMDSYKGGQRGEYTLDYFEGLWGMELESNKLPEAHPKT